MRFTLTCNSCGYVWSARGTHEPDVNATVIHDDDAGCEECGGDDFEIGEGEAEEWDDNVI